MKRREIFAGNWKMYKTHDEAMSLVRALVDGVREVKGREVVIFPPAPYAREIAAACRGTVISVGMQNMYFKAEGAFTGEIAPRMVRDCGCRWILIGHSERRHVFHETDAEVNSKVKAALENGLEPMICIGELLAQRENGTTGAVLKQQIEGALAGIDAASMAKIVFAYEPVWAIGTGKVATPEIAQETHAMVRGFLAALYSAAIAESTPILYGGSVKPDNIRGLVAMKDIDGVLVGGASLEAASFLDIALVG